MVKLTIIFCGCKVVRNIDVTLFYSLILIHYVGVKWNILIMTETRHKKIWFCSLIHRNSQFSVGVRCWNRTEVLKLKTDSVQRTPHQTPGCVLAQKNNRLVKYLMKTVWSWSTKERRNVWDRLFAQSVVASLYTLYTWQLVFLWLTYECWFSKYTLVCNKNNWQLKYFSKVKATVWLELKTLFAISSSKPPRSNPNLVKPR